MGNKVRTKKFAEMKRMLKFSDSRVKGKFHEKKKQKGGSGENGGKKLKTNVLSDKLVVHDAPKTSSALFFKFNTQLGPPYSVLLDTNFVNFSLKNKLDIHHGLMDTLYAKCTVFVTDCVVGELERLGSKFAVALRIMTSDPRIRRLTCTHRGLYADDCIVDRVTAHRCFCVATCDKMLKRRLRKIPGVPIVYIRQHRFSVERLPDAFGAPAL